MSALDDIIDIHESECRLTHAGIICCALEPSRSELASLRASLAAARARVSELESENAALIESFNSEHASVESIAKRETWYNAEIERLNAIIDNHITTLAPRKCAPDCYRKGWEAAIEAAADFVRGFGFVYEFSKRDRDLIGARDVNMASGIAALQTPADCGDCNPLAPDAITVSDFRRAVAHLVRYMPCDANDTNSTRLQIADAIESLTDSEVIDINSL